MGTTGTVVNGRIELDEPDLFPEGTKVWIDDEEEVLAVPPPDETYEQHLANLRQSIADGKAGVGRPWREVFEELSTKYGLPPLPVE